MSADMVWMATRRRGLNYHLLDVVPIRTRCGRSTRTGVLVPLSEVAETSACCRLCHWHAGTPGGGDQ